MKDIPHVFRSVGAWTFLKRIYNQSFFEDNLLVWAAALAFSWLLALFPFLIFAISLVPLLPDGVKPSEASILQSLEGVLVTGESLGEAAKDIGREIASPEAENRDPALNEPGDAVPTTLPAADDATAQPADATPSTTPAAAAVDGGDLDNGDADAMGDRLSNVVDDAVDLLERDEAGVEPADDAGKERQPQIISQTITSLVSDLINKPPTTFSLLVSVGIALFTASGGVAMTMAGLDKCYDVAPDKIRPVYYSRPLAMLLTIILAVLILLTVVILPIGGRVITWMAEQDIGGFKLGWLEILTRVLRWGLGLLLMLSALGVLYKLGPSVKTRLHLFSPGSCFAVGMWVATAFGFQFYIEQFNAADSYARTYGAVAGVAILMLLFYLDALFLLIGAEINAEIDFIRLGIKSGPLPEEREVASIPPYQLDDEDRELKAELERSRSVDIDKPAIDRTPDGEPQGDVLDA